MSNTEVNMQERRRELVKFGLSWVLAAGTFGALGLWVLNTLFALGLAFTWANWGATTVGLFLITAGRAFGTYKGP